MSNRYFALTLLALTLSSQPACDCDVVQGAGLACIKGVNVNYDLNLNYDMTPEPDNVSCAHPDGQKHCTIDSPYSDSMSFAIGYTGYKISSLVVSYFCNQTAKMEKCNVNEICTPGGSCVPFGGAAAGDCNSEFKYSVKTSGNSVPQKLFSYVEKAFVEKSVDYAQPLAGELFTIYYPMWCVVSSVVLYSKDNSMPAVRFVP